MTEDIQFKTKEVGGRKKASSFRKYRDLYYGDMPLHRAILCEFVISSLSGMSGAMGLFLRSRCYPMLFASVGNGVVFGRNITIRHPQRIHIGDNVVIDDNSVIDAKGLTNHGIEIGDNVYIGRNTIIYCKNGNIRIGSGVNISSNCQFVSSNDMTVGSHTVIGAYSYLLSGGGYDYTESAGKFSEQDGFITKGPLTVGPNCWLGAGVIVLDAACLGERCVIAAGAVVTQPIPANSMAGGTPAKVIKSI